MTDEHVGSLEEQAKKRKERLQQFKNKRFKSDTTGKQTDNPLPKPLFRSYKPIDEKLEENTLPDAEVPMKELESELATKKEKLVIGELDIQNLAPRKIDWDLKRDIAQKLEILERRTDRAVVGLIRERLNKKNGMDLAILAGPTGSGQNQDD